MNELKVFVWKNGKAQAQSGFNDDLVMSFSIGLFLRDTALRFRQQGVDLTRATLGNFQVSNTPSPGFFSYSNQSNNPYQMKDSMGNTEDLSWLLG
jgi:hypothetical protein